jgi:hypothetical protein
VGPGPRLVDGLELLAWIINGRRGPPSPARGRRRQLTQRNRLWSVTDAFQPAVHRPGRRGIELRPGTRTDRRGTHLPGWKASRSGPTFGLRPGRRTQNHRTSATDRDADPYAHRFMGWPPYAGARAANAYSLGHDRHSFGGVLALRRCRWRRLQHWSADRNLRPLIEARPICRHTFTGTRRACMSLVIENDGVADEPTPLVFLHCRAATEFEP